MIRVSIQQGAACWMGEGKRGLNMIFFLMKSNFGSGPSSLSATGMAQEKKSNACEVAAWRKILSNLGNISNLGNLS